MIADHPNDFGEILHVDVVIDDDQRLCKHHLTQAP